MSQTTNAESNKKTVDLATFYIGEALCGMDILRIQEINKHLKMTKVPQAQEYVTGILNLRGEIVTVIDFGIKLGLSSTRISEKTRNIIVNSKDEHVGLLVDSIADVVQADSDKIEPAPANIGGVKGKYFEGVFKTEKSLIGILNVEEVLKNDKG
ncbi:MAG: chemotaxis protein CheW [Deltaproteobacteria bacterium]|nr:chemotaxis protein CheW [Deltaproteobacteria bacterium]